MYIYISNNLNVPKNLNIPIVLDVQKCYCENENGGIENNGIVCIHDDNTVTTTSCQEYEGCTGTTKQIDGVMNPRLLCEKGKSI